MPDRSENVGLGRRRASRLRVICEARLITREGTRRVRLNDVSVSGAHVSGLLDVRESTWCVLKFPGFEMYGWIAWMRATHCGIRFDEPITAEAVLQIKARYPDVPEHMKLPTPDRTRRI